MNSGHDGEPQGYVKLYRRLLDHPRFIEGDWLKVWIFCLCKASHKPLRRTFARGELTLRPGQFISSAEGMARKLGIQKSKLDRILRQLKSDKQIDWVTDYRCCVFTVLKWDEYQGNDKPNDKPEAPANEGEITQVIEYLNEKTDKHFPIKTPATRSMIAARLKDYTLADLKRVIDIKTAAWKGDPKMDAYLRPKTLFAPANFDGYANESSPPMSIAPGMPALPFEDNYQPDALMEAPLG